MPAANGKYKCLLLKMINKVNANQALVSDITGVSSAYVPYIQYIQLYRGGTKTETNEDAVTQFIDNIRNIFWWLGGMRYESLPTRLYFPLTLSRTP